MKTSSNHSRLSHSAFICIFLLLTALARANPQIGSSTGFTRGLAHPLTVLDHIRAMIANG